MAPLFMVKLSVDTTILPPNPLLVAPGMVVIDTALEPRIKDDPFPAVLTVTVPCAPEPAPLAIIASVGVAPEGASVSVMTLMLPPVPEARAFDVTVSPLA